MIDYGKARLAVIGMGWIGEYMVPCYERLLGNGHASRILAVKATDRRLEELRKRYRFEVMAGDLSLINISEPTRIRRNSYDRLCLKKKKTHSTTRYQSNILV